MAIKLTPDQEIENKAAHEALNRINKISGFSVVESVFEQMDVVSVKKNSDGTYTENKVSAGWYVRLVGSSAVFVGYERPPEKFMRGARCKLSLEIVPDAPKAEAATAEKPIPPKPVRDHAAHIGEKGLTLADAIRGA
jgi:hypothetical protein